MRSGAFGTAAVTAAVLALPAPALAASQWEVSPTFAAGCDSGHRCHSLTDVKNAGPSDGDVVLVDPGTYSESPTFPVPLTLRGNKPGDATIRGTIAFSLPAGPASSTPVTVQRLIVLPTSGDALSITTNPATAGTWTVEIESTILSGTSTGAGLHVVTGAGAGTVSATGRHVTIADAGSADATNLVNNGVTAPSAAFVDSIVLGSTSAGTNVGGEASVADRSATFVNPGAEDFHLRAHAPEIDLGHSGQGGELAQDVDGDARPFGSAWDLGADEFVEHAPFIVGAGGSAGAAVVGEVVFFGVSGGDPDPGDSVTYHWSFGDGAGANGPSVGHAFGAPGAYTPTVTATDTYGRTATATVPVRMVSASSLSRSGDRTPPRVSITTPRPGQRLREGRTVPRFAGRVSDDSGVRRVELALFRRRGRGCLWFDGRRGFRSGSCSRARWFRALVNDFTWLYFLPRNVRPAPGPYSLEVRATDIVGNRTARVSARARTLVAFRFTR